MCCDRIMFITTRGSLAQRGYFFILLYLRYGGGASDVAGSYLHIYGIKVSFWGSGTLKIVIYVEKHPQKRFFWLADYHPLWVWGVN